MNLLAQLIVWINMLTNALGKLLLAPISVLPGWLSNTIVSAVAGMVLLIIFKYTSNQRAIGRIRDNIKANMLALKLFKDSISVTLQAQLRVFKGALFLLLYAIQPMLIMIVPVSLLLAQLGLWYQSRPLKPNEQTVVTMKLNNNIDSSWPDVSIKSIPGAEVTLGPVRAFSKREVSWEIKALEKGYHNIVFEVDQEQIKKQFVVGDGFMRVSVERPNWHWANILLHPLEKPFGPDSTVQSISVNYPGRLSRTSGSDWWLVYFFIVSLLFALVFKPFLKVKL